MGRSLVMAASGHDDVDIELCLFSVEDTLDSPTRVRIAGREHSSLKKKPPDAHGESGLDRHPLFPGPTSF